MEPPEKPDESDCCNSGCSPCILDVYQKQLELYNQRISSGWTGDGEKKKNAISETKFNEFEVTEIEKVGQDHLIITFRSNMENSILNYSSGQHFMLKADQTTRPYTPLKYFKDKPLHFTIVVKIYPSGIVSNYLERLKVGDTTLWRGPYGEYEYKPNGTKHLLMIAQGTGIAPIYSVIEEILKNELDESLVKLICCFSGYDSILLRDRLYEMKSFWNFSYEIYLGSDAELNNKNKYREVIKHEKFEADALKLLIENKINSIRILICGSDNFCKHFKEVVLLHGVKLEDIFVF